MTDSSIVLVTGGNTGIGFETIKALYASPEAHTILMGSRSLDKAEDAISALQSEISETKSKVVPVQIDIEDDSSMENAFKEIESKYGRIDALVNNAGNFPYPNTPEQLTINTTQAVHLMEKCAMTPAFAPCAPSGTTPTPST
jgi:NAD(P)-dependent dehydrogenase (short-subunit alcohol dehydrogenase family)